MTADSKAFDANLSAWKDWQSTPWGRLRYSIARANLNRHLEPRTLRILDVGGGNGLDVIPFAAEGHHVSIVDFSADMLTEARRSAEASGVAERVTLHQADLTSIPNLFADGVFDVILCHNVVQYVDGVRAMLVSVSQPLRQNGLLSLLSVNRYSEAYRQALQRLDFPKALDELGATSAVADVFGVPVRRFVSMQLLPPLRAAGFSVVAQYGVRCVCDYLADNELKADPAYFAELERPERAMSDRYPYYLLARYFQVVARKASSGSPDIRDESSGGSNNP
jgi:S-adenosylmethionine-dependent methyltransferase